MTLGEKIAKLRTEQHLSQGDLAEKIEVSRQSISKWETGNRLPDLNKLIALSEFFNITLDSLVKEESLKENMDSKLFAPQQSVKKYPSRKIMGWILVGIGLLSIVLGLVLNLILSVLGVYLLLCGIICHVVKKYSGIIIGWGTFLLLTCYFHHNTSVDMRMIFNPYTYLDGLYIQLIISYAFWIVLFLLIFLTVKNTRIKNHLFLYFGWAIFSQVYGFIPIAFSHTEKTLKPYLVLSWCTILFLIVLVFFSGKYLYHYLKSSKK